METKNSSFWCVKENTLKTFDDFYSTPIKPEGKRNNMGGGEMRRMSIHDLWLLTHIFLLCSGNKKRGKYTKHFIYYILHPMKTSILKQKVPQTNRIYYECIWSNSGSITYAPYKLQNVCVWWWVFNLFIRFPVKWWFGMILSCNNEFSCWIIFSYFFPLFSLFVHTHIIHFVLLWTNYIFFAIFLFSYIKLHFLDFKLPNI